MESLDVLRGFDMFFIFLADPVPCICWTFLAMFGLQSSWFGLRSSRSWKMMLAKICIPTTKTFRW